MVVRAWVFLVVFTTRPARDCSMARVTVIWRSGAVVMSTGRRAMSSPHRSPLRCLRRMANAHSPCPWSASAVNRWLHWVSLGRLARGMNPTAWAWWAAFAEYETFHIGSRSRGNALVLWAWVTNDRMAEPTS